MKRTKLWELRIGRNLHLEGIVLRGSPHSGVFFVRFDDVVVRNVENVSWFSKADGIYPMASEAPGDRARPRALTQSIECNILML